MPAVYLFSAWQTPTYSIRLSLNITFLDEAFSTIPEKWSLFVGPSNSTAFLVFTNGTNKMITNCNLGQ